LVSNQNLVHKVFGKHPAFEVLGKDAPPFTSLQAPESFSPPIRVDA
jgi:hypothetical protein